MSMSTLFDGLRGNTSRETIILACQEAIASGDHPTRIAAICSVVAGSIDTRTSIVNLAEYTPQPQQQQQSRGRRRPWQGGSFNQTPREDRNYNIGYYLVRGSMDPKDFRKVDERFAALVTHLDAVLDGTGAFGLGSRYYDSTEGRGNWATTVYDPERVLGKDGQEKTKETAEAFSVPEDINDAVMDAIGTDLGEMLLGFIQSKTHLETLTRALDVLPGDRIVEVIEQAQAKAEEKDKKVQWGALGYSLRKATRKAVNAAKTSGVDVESTEDSETSNENPDSIPV